MSGEDRHYAQPRRSTKTRRDEQAQPPATLQMRRRNLPMTDEDYLGEDDPLASRPPRPGSSAIRLNNPPTSSQRAITGGSRQVVPYNRRTGQQPVTTAAQPVPVRPARNTSTQQTPLYPPPPPVVKERRKVHWLLPIGVGMLAMLALWVIFSVLLAWGTARYEDIKYGNPRTYQTDFAVGHGGDSLQHPSHFIAINLNRHIVVIEFMAGDPAKAITYGGPYLYGVGQDLTPPVLEFRDVTNDGKVDMIIHIADQSVVFINTGDKFRPATASDNIHL